jgi:hypothetical protein
MPPPQAPPERALGAREQARLDWEQEPVAEAELAEMKERRRLAIVDNITNANVLFPPSILVSNQN